MSRTLLAKLQPTTPSGFFDLGDPSPVAEVRGALAATAARAVAQGVDQQRLDEVIRRTLEDLEEGNAAYVLSSADAADMNAAVELPDQPEYDWSGVIDDEDYR